MKKVSFLLAIVLICITYSISAIASTSTWSYKFYNSWTNCSGSSPDPDENGTVTMKMSLGTCYVTYKGSVYSVPFQNNTLNYSYSDQDGGGTNSGTIIVQLNSAQTSGNGSENWSWTNGSYTCSGGRSVEIQKISGQNESTWYRDADNDGYGDYSNSTKSVVQPSGYVSDSSDCNDGDAAIHPGKTEICNNKDDNCNGSVDEGCNTTADVDRDDFFDAAFYLQQNPDILQVFGNDHAAAKVHWNSYGIYEGRQASPAFDVTFYLNKYPDLKQAFGNNYYAAFEHWVNYGVYEGRQGAPVEDKAGVNGTIIFDTNNDVFNDMLTSVQSGARILIYATSTFVSPSNYQSAMIVEIHGYNNNEYYLPEGFLQIALPETIDVDYENIDINGWVSAKLPAVHTYPLGYTNDCGAENFFKSTIIGLIPGGNIFNDIFSVISMVQCAVDSKDDPTANTLFRKKNSHDIVNAIWDNDITDVDLVKIEIPVNHSVNDVINKLTNGKMALYTKYKNINKNCGPITSSGLCDKTTTIEVLADNIMP